MHIEIEESFRVVFAKNGAILICSDVEQNAEDETILCVFTDAREMEHFWEGVTQRLHSTVPAT
tara:strand:- start:692 stop:880 length:189 start_codon:yes stop_codon:yes gene_type:complete